MTSIFYAKILNSKKSLGFIGLMFALPLILTFIFGGMNGSEGRQTLLIVDGDQTVYAQRLIDEIDKTNTYKISIVSTELMENLLRDRRAQFAILIPKGLHNAISSRESVDIKLYRTIENSDFFALQSVLQGITRSLDYKSNIVYEGSNILSHNLSDIDSIEKRLYTLLEEKGEGLAPLSTNTRVYGNDRMFLDQKTQASLGFLLFFSMYPVIFILGEILEDKRLLIWDRLLLSPLSKIKLYVSNLVFVFIIGMLQISLLMFLNYIIFGIEFGQNLLGLFSTMAAFIFTVSALGLFISSFVKTNQQLSSIAPVIIVSTSMLGGLFWPTEIISNTILQAVAKLTPQFWAMDSMKKVIVHNGSYESILLNILILIMMGVIFLGTAIQIKEDHNR